MLGIWGVWFSIIWHGSESPDQTGDYEERPDMAVPDTLGLVFAWKNSKLYDKQLFFSKQLK